MELLTLTPRLLTLALAVGFGSFLTIAGGIVVARIARDARSRYAARNIEADERRILQFIQSGDPKLAAEMTRTVALREHIIKVGRGLSGDLLSKLMILYTTLEFTRGDFRAMAHGRRQTRLLAMERCRALLIPLPEEAWSILLSDRLPSARWAAMEYLIAAKGRAALPWVLHYIVEETAKRKARKGVLVHLAACLAQHTPEILPHLLDHVDRDAHREILLLVLAQYPSLGAEHRIVRALRADSSASLLLAGVKALGSHPSRDSLAAIGFLAENKIAGIRQAVAEALSRFGDPAAADMLGRLAVDSSYQVRLAAVTSLVELRADLEIEVIAQDPAHPAHLMWRRFSVARPQKGAA